MVTDEVENMKLNLKSLLEDNSSEFSFNHDDLVVTNMTSHYGITIDFIDAHWKFQSIAVDLVAS